MGRTVGVVHATGERDAEFDEAAIHDLATLANLAGARIGLLRMVADTQLQAATDSLTGLLNRRSLENRVRLLRADDIGYTVVMADLDHFKALNDTYGHETGDRALRLFAQTLKAGLRNTDLVCRHGGEEFAVVLPDCRALDAHAAMQLFQTKLTDAARSSGLPSFTASFGVVEARDTEDLAAAIAGPTARCSRPSRTAGTRSSSTTPRATTSPSRSTRRRRPRRSSAPATRSPRTRPSEPAA